MECNFKTISLSGKENHVLQLNVICRRTEACGYFYLVEGQSYEESLGILISSKSAGGGDTSTFNTPDEAYTFADKIAEKYPRYGDDRDFGIDLAPLYEGVEM